MKKRTFLSSAAAVGLGVLTKDGAAFDARRKVSDERSETADLILVNGRIHTMNRKQRLAQAVAIASGKFLAVGENRDAMRHADSRTQIIDLGGRTVIPGLNDSHLHLIRGGLTYNLELRWEGVPSLADALRMLKDQAAVTPPPQWVRVVGGWSEFQFAERRMPTLEEINAVAPDTPVFVMHLYDRAWLNRAALRAVGYTRQTPEPPGAEIQRDANGEPTGMLIAKPNAAILYATLNQGPKLPLEYKLNSTRQFMRELNRLGVTSAVDAAGGYQSYPDDYQVIEQLAKQKQMTVRIAYNLCPQRAGSEYEDLESWVQSTRPGKGDDFLRNNGAGEALVWSALDFEDFMQPRPTQGAEMERDLERVARLLVAHRWPFRIHATYNESIERILNVFEKVDRDIPFDGLTWIVDHAETITPRNIERIGALGGGIAIQHRMAFQGEYFVQRYGKQAAAHTPPIARMLDLGVPVGGGTDATRVASYNPWTALYWLVSGKTVGGMSLYGHANRLSRETALELWTVGSAWFSSDSGRKGAITPGQLADLAVLSDDYFSIPHEQIKAISSMLTIVGGDIVHAYGEFAHWGPMPLPVMPDWSPLVKYPGHFRLASASTGKIAHQCRGACAVHGHVHDFARRSDIPVSDVAGFWGALGCSCFSF
ncbi:Exoenzymes regulatory protein AepA precursor [Burkholderia singularis]|uniref:Exoenzymes regulatory protein AepA n=2 Tax=Burkholderia singularis TaxID=1503053 RepID=A0A238H2B4_9BURK|nr:Exoenzymes regulatory protein AepA precursor [Burkholderia singularis]